MPAGYFDSKEIELCNAIGEFTVIEDSFERYLPFPKEQMNLVIKYEEGEDLKGLKSDFEKMYPGMDLDVPKMAASGRVFKAVASGTRSAIIHTPQFDNEVEVDGHKATGVKIKGCRVKEFPPLPSTYTPELRDGKPFPEDFIAFDKDGKPFETFKDQPWGMTVEDAHHEVTMSILAHDLGIPVNVAGLGYGSYSGSFYPGHPNTGEHSNSGQMGTGVFAMFGSDERVSDLVMNMKELDDHESLEIPTELATMVINNLQSATQSLGVDYHELFYDMIFRKSGEILDQMHSSGIIHGPRQSHYMNYTMPTKEYRDLQICDFESSFIISRVTDIQALKFMTNDFYQLIAASHRFYKAAVTSVGKALKSNTVPEGFDPKGMLMQLVDREPADAVICGYTDGEIGLEDVKDYDPWDLESHIIERARKESLQCLREQYGMLFEKLEKLRTSS